MTLTPTPHSEPAQQVDAGVARALADRFAVLADTLELEAERSHLHRKYNIRCAREALLGAVEARTYAALVEADDFIEPRGGAR